MFPTKLVEDVIDEVEFQVIIAPNVKVCKLVVEGQDCFISDVDLAQVIRAIINSDNLFEVREGLRGIWREETAIAMVQSWIDYFIDGSDCE